jgi:hypothetical protein
LNIHGAVLIRVIGAARAGGAGGHNERLIPAFNLALGSRKAEPVFGRRSEC